MAGKGKGGMPESKRPGRPIAKAGLDKGLDVFFPGFDVDGRGSPVFVRNTPAPHFLSDRSLAPFFLSCAILMNPRFPGKACTGFWVHSRDEEEQRIGGTFFISTPPEELLTDDVEPGWDSHPWARNLYACNDAIYDEERRLLKLPDSRIPVRISWYWYCSLIVLEPFPDRAYTAPHSIPVDYLYEHSEILRLFARGTPKLPSPLPVFSCVYRIAGIPGRPELTDILPGRGVRSVIFGHYFDIPVGGVEADLESLCVATKGHEGAFVAYYNMARTGQQKPSIRIFGICRSVDGYYSKAMLIPDGFRRAMKVLFDERTDWNHEERLFQRYRKMEHQHKWLTIPT
ncbi:hypothetical protein Dda_5994 [Drechslerella dactyloides]|uniref:Uncharacterized protein n=1 Tax=Drechslerella dactyloides TaxID=74499 RepID=A0AAD6IVG2_DREDA|nr:hypothetical protein Dda_5994 [Drechslerella dactyloides]